MTQVMVERKVKNLKCQFDFRPLKVGNRFEYVSVGRISHIVGKISMRTITLFKPHLNQRSA